MFQDDHGVNGRHPANLMENLGEHPIFVERFLYLNLGNPAVGESLHLLFWEVLVRLKAV